MPEIKDYLIFPDGTTQETAVLSLMVDDEAGASVGTVSNIYVPTGTLEDLGDGVTVRLHPPAFTQLPDVPASYSGNADKVPRVRGDETGLAFADAAYPIEVTNSTGSVVIPNISGLQFLNGTVSDPATGGAEYTAPEMTFATAVKWENT